jgi:hypothetical protein
MDVGSIGTERNKAVVAEFDKLIGSDDLSALDRLCRPDMINHALAPDRPSGLAGTREFLETMGRHQMTQGVGAGSLLSPRATTSSRWGPDMAVGVAGHFWASTHRQEITIATSPPCTGSSLVRSLSGGRSATTSACFVNSAPSPVTNRRPSSRSAAEEEVKPRSPD